MNAKLILPLVAIAAALAGCSTYPQYPVTYQVPISNPVVTSDYGPPSLSVNAVQDVPAAPGQILYYQVLAPMNVVFYAFDKTTSGPGGPLLGQMQGTTLYSSVVPTSDKVEFVFSATQPVTGGSIQLTVSDHPMTAGSNALPYTTPGPMGPAGPAMQPAVMVAPGNASIATGQSITFTASGGAGSGNFVWQGAAAATGYSNIYTFNAPGTYTITVYRSGDGTYGRSNTASAIVSVSPPVSTMPSQGSPAVTVTPAQ